ncbi:hypothetical protein M0R45_000548 [Rubus argutus]|uniref:Uncharacterized protein n=1 Tax=Rubus argutus TaxID=59490 RepID=A0AAW1VNX4_RUBAR
MARRLHSFVSLNSSLCKVPKPQRQAFTASKIRYLSDSALSTSTSRYGGFVQIFSWIRIILRDVGILKCGFAASRSYARGDHKYYDLFGNGKPGDKDFRKAWKKEIEEDDGLWTGSEDEKDDRKDEKSQLEEEIRKVKQQAREHSDLIDADDSDELRSVWSGSDEEKSLWTGSEEYAELRQGGPKKLNIQFFKDIQARMRDPNYKFSPELKLKPKSKLVPKKKWQKAQSRRRKAQKR